MVRIRLILTLCCSFFSIAALQAQPLYVGEFNVRNDNAAAVRFAPTGSMNYFKTNLLDHTEPLSIDVKSKDSFMIVICLEGKCVLKDLQENSITLKQGETILVPASTKNVTFIPESKMKILTSWV